MCDDSGIKTKIKIKTRMVTSEPYDQHSLPEYKNYVISVMNMDKKMKSMLLGQFNNPLHFILDPTCRLSVHLRVDTQDQNCMYKSRARRPIYADLKKLQMQEF